MRKIIAVDCKNHGAIIDKSRSMALEKLL